MKVFKKYAENFKENVCFLKILSFIVGAICVHNREACLCVNGKSNLTNIKQNLIFPFYQNVM